MIAPIQLQCIFSYTILAKFVLKACASNTYKSKPVLLLIPKMLSIHIWAMNNNAILVAGKYSASFLGRIVCFQTEFQIEFLRRKMAQVPNLAKLSFWWILKDDYSHRSQMQYLPFILTEKIL